MAFIFSMLTIGVENAQSQQMCQDLFSKSRRQVEIVSHSTQAAPAASKIKIKLEALSTDPNVALAQIIEMATLTPDVYLNEKSAFKNNRLKLGVALENGYSLEITYKADYREKASFTLEGAKIISPTNRSEIISKNYLEYKELNLRENTEFDLSDIYPDGRDITVRLPAVIDGKPLELFTKMLPKFEYLSKQQIRDALNTKSFGMFKLYVQNHFLSGYLTEYVFKGFFKTSVKIMLLPIMVVVGLQFKPEITEAYNYINPAKIEWVQPTMHRLESSVPADLKLQISNILNNLPTELLATNMNQYNVKTDLNAPKIKLSSDQYVWVAHGVNKLSGEEKTFLIVTNDTGKGQIEYFTIEIDKEKNSTLIEYFKSQGTYIRVPAVK